MTDQLCRRELTLRAATDTETREFSGLAVPYNTETAIDDWMGIYREQFAPGAVQDSDDALIFWQHREVVGKITAARDTPEGWAFDARISATARGDEAYTLLRDGVVTRLSVGFVPIEWTDAVDEDGTIHRTHNKVLVREVSLVPFPAYPDAAVTSVRAEQPAKEPDMPPAADTLTRADLTPVTDQLDELTRSVELLRTEGHAPAEHTDLFGSFGDYVKRTAAGDEIALRAYTGAVSGDAILKDAWVGNLVRILGGRQPVKNAFTTGALPSTGLKVEYAKLKSDTTQVTKQASEGADLAFGKVAIETATADVETYGGYSELTRQTIERSDVGILDTTFTALAIKYATAIETKVRAVLNAAFDAVGAGALQSVTLPTTGDDDIKWISALIDVAQKFDDNERTLAGLFVSKPVFLTLAAIAGKDRFMQVAGGPAGQNAAGTINVPQLGGSLANIPVRILPGWTTGNKVLAYDPFAIKTLESPGAPLRLQDENIVNLSKAFSVYGYASSFVQAADGLVKVTLS